MKLLNRARLVDGRVVCVYQVFPGDPYYEEYFDLRTQTWCKEVGGVYAEKLTPGQRYERDREDEKSSTLYAVAVLEETQKVTAGYRLFFRKDLKEFEVSRFLICSGEEKFKLPETRLIVATLVASMKVLLPAHTCVVATINSIFLALIKRLRIGVEFERMGPDVTYEGSEGQDIVFTPVRMSIPLVQYKVA